MGLTVTIWNPALLLVRRISGVGERVRALSSSDLSPVGRDCRRSIPVLSPPQASGVSLEGSLAILGQLVSALSELRRQHSAARRTTGVRTSPQ